MCFCAQSCYRNGKLLEFQKFPASEQQILHGTTCSTLYRLSHMRSRKGEGRNETDFVLFNRHFHIFQRVTFKSHFLKMCLEVGQCCFCVDLSTATRAIALMEAAVSAPLVVQVRRQGKVVWIILAHCFCYCFCYL